jgi:hypothetical protein
MTPKEQQVAIEEACGWTVWSCGVPDYLNDLNAMHEAEKVLNDEQHRQYRSEVWYSVCNDISSYECVKAAERPHFSATSHQRAEAFLKTLGKWEE